MNYWPLSTIATSSLCEHPEFRRELADVYRTCYLTPAVFNTCGYIARNTVPQKQINLVIVESVDAPARQLYVGYPNWEEWSRLERGAIIEASNGMLHVIIDALH